MPHSEAQDTTFITIQLSKEQIIPILQSFPENK